MYSTAKKTIAPRVATIMRAGVLEKRLLAVPFAVVADAAVASSFDSIEVLLLSVCLLFTICILTTASAIAELFASCLITAGYMLVASETVELLTTVLAFCGMCDVDKCITELASGVTVAFLLWTSVGLVVLGLAESLVVACTTSTLVVIASMR